MDVMKGACPGRRVVLEKLLEPPHPVATIALSPRYRGGCLSKKANHIERDKLTVRNMVGIYCRGNGHGPVGICSNCQSLVSYAQERFDSCPFYDSGKPACGLCKSNCFTPEMHRRFRQVMRYSGPRMLLRHPLLTLAHLWDAVTHR